MATTKETAIKDAGKNKQNNRSISIIIILLYLAVIAITFIPSPIETKAQSYYSNTTVITLLNISNAAPEILSIMIYDNDSLTGSNILLTPGTTDIITCNATVNDTNGWGDITYANGTLFHEGNWTDPNDNNARYENSSCSISQYGSTLYTAIVSCTFNVYFYAENGNWNCSISVNDTHDINDQMYADSFKVIDPLYAIDLDTNTIDYGVLNVTDISKVTTLNVTNAGNMDINISVEGYGSSLHDGLSMNCSLGSSINVSQQKYGINSTVNWSNGMSALSTDPLAEGINGLTIIQNQDDNGNSTNTTYWSIRAPIGAQSGLCNGSLIFSAIPDE